jgi:hypothetical protein
MPSLAYGERAGGKTVTVDGNKMLFDNKLELLCFILFLRVFSRRPSRALRAFAQQFMLFGSASKTIFKGVGIEGLWHASTARALFSAFSAVLLIFMEFTLELEWKKDSLMHF